MQAVCCEPVSATISPIWREDTGKRYGIDEFRQFKGANASSSQRLNRKYPDRKNRECDAYYPAI